MAIIAIYNACFFKTQTVVKIKWGEKTALGTWWKRMQEQRDSPENPLVSMLLSGLNLSKCSLDMSDFYKANLIYSIMNLSAFYNANLQLSNLRQVKLRNVFMIYANLKSAKS